MSTADMMTVFYLAIGVCVGILWITMYLQEKRDKSRTQKPSH